MSDRTRIQRKRENAALLPTIQDEAAQRNPLSVQQDVDEAPPIVNEVLTSSGQPLDTGMRTFMEPRFGHDFSQVRVHTDERAVASAQAVNALAYTVGQDVVFGDGAYKPGTSEGQMLLAHELTHVVQQVSPQHAPVSHQMSVSEPQEPLELEADQIAHSIVGDSMQGTPLASQLHDANPATIHRKPEIIPWSGLGSTIGADNSNVWFNPHADLYIDGRFVQNSWFDPDPINASFTVSPGTTGKVVVVVDGGYFQENTLGNKSGNNSTQMEFPFEIRADGTLQWGAQSPSGNNPPGSIVQLLVPMTANTSTSSTGGLISVSPMFTVAGSDTQSDSLGPFGHSRGISLGGNVMRNYQVNLVVPKPEQPIPGMTFYTHTLGPFPIKKSIVNEELRASILGWYKSLPDFVSVAVQSGSIEVDIEGYASTTDNNIPNAKLSWERANNVMEVLHMYAGSDARFNVSGKGEDDAQTPDETEDTNERRVEISIAYISQKVDTSAPLKSNP
jgi:hypothetical protein